MQTKNRNRVILNEFTRDKENMSKNKMWIPVKANSSLNYRLVSGSIAVKRKEYSSEKQLNKIRHPRAWVYRWWLWFTWLIKLYIDELQCAQYFHTVCIVYCRPVRNSFLISITSHSQSSHCDSPTYYVDKIHADICECRIIIKILFLCCKLHPLACHSQALNMALSLGLRTISIARF